MITSLKQSQLIRLVRFSVQSWAAELSPKAYSRGCSSIVNRLRARQEPHRKTGLVPSRIGPFRLLLMLLRKSDFSGIQTCRAFLRQCATGATWFTHTDESAAQHVSTTQWPYPGFVRSPKWQAQWVLGPNP